jgi:ABC-2 type transport system ATP-binding protein
MVKIRGLRKSYKNHEVLCGLDMNIADGDCYGFIGKNGSGKTTTMNIICDILSKDYGEVIVAKDEDVDLPIEEIKRRRAKLRIGYLPESPSLYGYMTGKQYLTYLAEIIGCDKTQAAGRVAQVLDIVGLRQEAASRKVKGYSRGMVQRLGIAAALIDDPDLLVLDEPTSALDPAGRAEVMQIISKLKSQGKTILLCTHILSDVERVANRVGFLVNGVMTREGSITEILGASKHPTDVMIRFTEPKLENFTALRSLPEVLQSEVNPITGELCLRGDDAMLVCRAAIAQMSALGIVPEKLEITRPNLEDMYLSMVNMAGGGR